MTDRKGNDLSYGHLGQATYDIDESQWGFSLSPEQRPVFEQILPFTQSQSPSTIDAVKIWEKNTLKYREQRRWLVKNRPEIFPATIISGAFSQSSIERDSVNGQLLAIGRAVRTAHLPAWKTEPVIAMPCGEAGSTLRLIKPRSMNHKWGRRSCVQLTMMATDKVDQGFWAGTGGTIHQVASVDDGTFSSNWLAVRQSSITTILRPLYHSEIVPAAIPSGFGDAYPPSRLFANPVAVLAADKAGSKTHVDVTFNPYYARQFAVIDDVGFWSVWNIEGRLRKQSTLSLTAGKHGYIDDEYMPDSHIKSPENVDEWHRLLWVSNVSTIMLCNRRRIAVFDLKMKPRRLQSPEILLPSSTDWILDIKRSLVHLNHVFVLTSSRIIWLEIIAGGKYKESEEPGAKVMLSHRHFRDPNDDTMKLTVLHDDNVSVLISSSKVLVVDFYKFVKESNTEPSSSHGSLILSSGDDHNKPLRIQTLLLVHASLVPRLSMPVGPELDYLHRGINFFQAWILNHNFELVYTLCAGYETSISTSVPRVSIDPPTWISLVSKGQTGKQLVSNSFIVPDGNLDEDILIRAKAGSSSVSDMILRHRDSRIDLRLRLNWRDVFRYIFHVTVRTSEPKIFMSNLHTNISLFLEQGAESGGIPMKPLLALSTVPVLARDLEKAKFRDYLEELQLSYDPDSSLNLRFSNLTICPGTRPGSERAELPDMLQVYDRLVSLWMENLPSVIPNQTRLSMFNLIRRISVELCLSSTAIGLSSRSLELYQSGTNTQEENALPTKEIDDLSRASSPFLPSSQVPPDLEHNTRVGLPTPAQTPSVHSHSSGASTEQTEDPLISRIRQHAVSIDSVPSLDRLPLLSRWPSVPEQDPAKYNWRHASESSATEGNWERRMGQRKHREQARHRRRAKEFLDRELSNTSGFSSQLPTHHISGSQPDIAQHAVSSQTVDDVPMTQPGRGVFGSRTAELAKKKQKRRRRTGF